MTPEQLTNLELAFICGAISGPVVFYVGAAVWILTGEWMARRRARRQGRRW